MTNATILRPCFCKKVAGLSIRYSPVMVFFKSFGRHRLGTMLSSWEEVRLDSPAPDFICRKLLVVGEILPLLIHDLASILGVDAADHAACERRMGGEIPRVH